MKLRPRLIVRETADMCVCVRCAVLFVEFRGGEGTLKPSEVEPNVKEVTNLQMR